MAKIDVKLKDETLGGKIINEIILSLESEIVMVKDILRARVYQEVEKYNFKLPEYFNGLVQPEEAEVTLNGYRLKNKRVIDQEKQFYVACDAYLKNSFFILIDDKQVNSLEQEVLLLKDMNISFVKLTPLVGG